MTEAKAKNKKYPTVKQLLRRKKLSPFHIARLTILNAINQDENQDGILNQEETNKILKQIKQLTKEEKKICENIFKVHDQIMKEVEDQQRNELLFSYLTAEIKALIYKVREYFQATNSDAITNFIELELLKKDRHLLIKQLLIFFEKELKLDPSPKEWKLIERPKTSISHILSKNMGPISTITDSKEWKEFISVIRIIVPDKKLSEDTTEYVQKINQQIKDLDKTRKEVWSSWKAYEQVFNVADQTLQLSDFYYLKSKGFGEEMIERNEELRKIINKLIDQLKIHSIILKTLFSINLPLINLEQIYKETSTLDNVKPRKSEAFKDFGNRILDLEQYNHDK